MEEARQPEYSHPLQASKMMSRSIHDVSRRAEEERSASLMRPPSRPPSAQGILKSTYLKKILFCLNCDLTFENSIVFIKKSKYKKGNRL